MKWALAVLVFGFFLLLCASCERKHAVSGKTNKIQVITTLFPLYDFTRAICGNKAEVVLLLPPGMESHSFEPKPDDIIKIHKSKLFVYTNKYMEPWAEDIIGSLDTTRTLVVDASRGTRLQKSGRNGEGIDEDGTHSHGGETHHRDGDGMDPHLWLDFGNAQKIVDNILAGLVVKDPDNREYYTANADAYKAKLADLDRRFRDGLSRCEKRVFLHGGHYAFGYLAHRYGLRYESAYAIAADAEPSPVRVAELIRRIRENGLHYIFAEELVEPRVADTIARETGAQVLTLHGAHNISRDDFASGVTFLSLMDRNLESLRRGLQCR